MILLLKHVLNVDHIMSWATDGVSHITAKHFQKIDAQNAKMGSSITNQLNTAMTPTA